MEVYSDSEDTKDALLQNQQNLFMVGDPSTSGERSERNLKGASQAQSDDLSNQDIPGVSGLQMVSYNKVCFNYICFTLYFWLISWLTLNLHLDQSLV